MEDFVDSCPQNITAALESSTRLGCGQDKYGNDQYICVPNIEKTGLIELCYNGIMGIIERGNCLRTTGGQLYRTSCLGFSSGCPEEEYKSNKIYKYPSCQSINKQHGCYFAESSCPNAMEDITTRDTTEISTLGLSTNLSIYNTTTMILKESTPLPQDEDNYTAVVVGSLISVVLIIVLLVLAIILWKKKCRKKKREKELTSVEGEMFLPEKGIDTSESANELQQDNITTQYQGEVNISTAPSYERPLPLKRANNADGTGKVQETGVNTRQEERDHDETDGGVIDGTTEADSASQMIPISITVDEDKQAQKTPTEQDDSQGSEENTEECSIDFIIPLGAINVQETDVNIGPQERVHSVTETDVIDSTTESTNPMIPSTSSDTDDEGNTLLKVQEAIVNTGPKESVHVVTEADINNSATESGSANPTITTSNTYDKHKQAQKTPTEQDDSQGSEENTEECSIDFISKSLLSWREYNLWKTQLPGKYYNYSIDVRCQLYCLLLAAKYQLNVNEQSHIITWNKIRDRYFQDFTDDGSINLPDEFTETHNGVMTFTSEDIRHDVMYTYVTECMVEDSDLEFFLTTASRDVISEYCRSWEYKRSQRERCLFVPERPEKMYDLFIDKLQLDIITHCTLSDLRIHGRISNRLGVPREVLKWDQEARERYVEYAKRGTQTIHHARGMIVGCAGAGKTTLLKRLLGCSEKEIQEVESTEGLEVHEEVFEMCDETKSLKARMIIKDDKNGQNSGRNVDTKTLSFFDFGGQCAYYACHQIYLTRRAFYVVVLDASKRLDQKVDKKVCDQDGSVFSEWTYGDYFVFWIKSIHTYCGSENEKDTKPIVLIVATHWEEGHRQYQDKDALMYSLQEQLPKESNLSQYIEENNCYCTQFPVQSLHDLEERVYDIASHQRWKENIPKEWAFFEIEINLKKHSERILDIGMLTTKVTDNIDKEQRNPKGKSEKKDMLRYYHDAGKALYFNEEELEKFVIIDVQWFIDAFKHIITDKLHFKGIEALREDWDEYYKTGNMRDRLLTKIWKHEDEMLCGKENNKYRFNFFSVGPDLRCLLYHKEMLLSFMQRLGLMAVGQGSHYVPSMNRKEIEKAIPDLIHRSESKTSVLIYRFSFLPYFLFFRLVVSCMQLRGWKVLVTDETSCLYRNAALFSVYQYNIVLSVTETSIQVQVFHPVHGCSLEKDKTYNIQKTIEGILKNISGTFRRNLLYKRGFRCREDSTQTIAMDIKGHFVLGKYIYENDGDIICPLHPLKDQHSINTNEMSKFWNLRRRELSTLSEDEAEPFS